MARLGNLIEQIRGVSYKPEDVCDKLGENCITLLRANNIKDGQLNFDDLVFVDKKRVHDNQLLKAGDILVCTSSGSKELVGKAAYIKEDLPMTFGAFCKVVRPQKIRSDYLGHFFNSPNYRKKISDSSAGANINNIRNEHIDELEILLPTADRQEYVAVVLDQLSALISLRKQQLSKLDELVKSRFIELFGVPGAKSDQWPRMSLGDCCILNPKKNLDTRLVPELNVSFVPMSAVSEDGDMEVSETRKYEDVKTGFTYFADNDILFAKITPCMENGKGAIARKLINGIGFGSTEFHVLRPIQNKSNPYWLYVMTALESFRTSAKANMTGSAGQKRVPASYLEAYQVSLPPMELQEQFASFVKQTNQSKPVIRQSLDRLETLKKSLMQEYFA
jgi:type I restriction enzyme S subunit